MITKSTEKGQALIIIALAAMVLFGFAALAIDGSAAFSDKRHAQNAADTAAMAAALGRAKDKTADYAAVAQARSTTNSYNNDHSTNYVTITSVATPIGTCPDTGIEITVKIDSIVKTSFARVLGWTQLVNHVSATSRTCDYSIGGLFHGNAIGALTPSPSGTCGIDTGNSNAKDWTLTGGGVFSNGCLTHPNGTLNVPDDKCVSSAGTAVVTGGGTHTCVQENESGAAYNYPSAIAAMMPPNPCTGAITGGVYAGGGIVPTNGQTTFNNGVYCIDMNNIDGHGNYVLNNATWYVTSTSFHLKFNGNAGLSGTGTTTSGSPYKGYFMIIAMTPTKLGADNCDESIEMRGNGDSDLVGTIFAPSACFDARGNSGNGAVRSQYVFYNVSSNGAASIKVDYNTGDNPLYPSPPAISLIK